MEVEKYKILFDFDLEKRRYNCQEEIYLKNIEKESIELDAVDLDIKEVWVDEKMAEFYLENEKLKIKPAGQFIKIKFENELKETLGGIYLSKYGENKYLITSQFEPVDARRAFVCFDDPSKKAIFEISMIIDKNLIGISNMPIVEEKELDNNKKLLKFAPTPKMSTYLLYIGVGEFEFLEDKYRDVLIRVITTPGKKEGGLFALDFTKKCLEFYEDYFAIKYPLPKLDLISAPDFAAGAMENWGAITFRENNLLFFEKESSLLTKLRIAEVIAHELAHMWFGNLVTMKWWDDLWLNESFATFIAYKALEKFFPEWQVWEYYIYTETIEGLRADGLKNTHPIKVEIKNIAESQEIFDEISYNKGGSVLRMIENYLGEEVFRDGLRNYLKKFEYQNASAEDLWQSLEDVSQKNVKAIMNDFVTKTGFPLIKASKNQNVLLEQERFLFLGNAEDVWKIPIVAEIDDQKERFIFENKNLTLEKSFKDKLILNSQYSGFYVTFYDEKILDVNLRSLNLNDEKTNLGLINDIYLCLIKGLIKEENYFEILENYFLNLDQFFVENEILAQLNFLYYFNQKDKIKELLEKFSKKAIEKIGTETRPNDQPIEILLRQSALLTLGLLENKEIIELAENKFNEKFIDPNLKNFVYSTLVRNKPEYFYTLYDLYLKADIKEEKARFLLALGKVKKENLISEILNKILSDEIRFGEVIYLFSSLSNNFEARNLVFEWLDNNWNQLEAKGGGRGKSDFVLIRILKTTIPKVGAFQSKEKLEEFFEKYNLQHFEKTKNIVLEKTEINKMLIA